MRALSVTHFVNNWGPYVVVAWLPQFYTETLGVGLDRASTLALIPPALSIPISAVATPLADTLLARGTPVTTVRKLCQGVAFFGACSSFLCASLSGDEAVPTVAAVSTGVAISAFSFGGLYSNHQDLSPRYASTLIGVTNTAGAVPGFLGVGLTGLLRDMGYSWDESLLWPCVGVYLLGFVIYLAFGSGEEQDF